VPLSERPFTRHRRNLRHGLGPFPVSPRGVLDPEALAWVTANRTRHDLGKRRFPIPALACSRSSPDNFVGRLFPPGAWRTKTYGRVRRAGGFWRIGLSTTTASHGAKPYLFAVRRCAAKAPRFPNCRQGRSGATRHSRPAVWRRPGWPRLGGIGGRTRACARACCPQHPARPVAKAVSHPPPISMLKLVSTIHVPGRWARDRHRQPREDRAGKHYLGKAG